MSKNVKKFGDFLNEGKQRMSMKHLEDIINDFNKENGTKFNLSASYGYYELWYNDENRLETGSLKQIFDFFNKVKYKEKYQVKK